jgi:hypothetical protein
MPSQPKGESRAVFHQTEHAGTLQMHMEGNSALPDRLHMIEIELRPYNHAITRS